MKKLIRRTGIALGSLALLWLVTGAALALSPAPALRHPRPDPGSSRPCRAAADVRCLAVRDGEALALRGLEQEGRATIVLLHGVLSSGAELEEAARRLREATGARVVRVDLRGHGLSSGRPGDVERIGQYEEDVADVVASLRREHPGAPLVLAGHSMGGGIALRYAARRDLPAVDGYLLFAPLLGAGAPTERTAPSGAEPVMKVHVRRLIGLAMLDAVGIHGWDGWPTLFFDLPFAVPIPTYSFRALAGMAPRDYRAALAADSRPLLALVGAEDEAFRAEAYPAVIARHRNGRTVVLTGESHDGVMRSAAAFEKVREWFRAYFGASTSETSAVPPAFTTAF